MPLGAKKGNLVENGGFEQGLGSWLSITNVGLASSPLCHEGLIAAAMGKPDNLSPSDMFQDVPVLPGHTYKLEFSVSSLAGNPGDLSVDVFWLSGHAGITGQGLEHGPVLVPGETTGLATHGAWKTVTAYTTIAPLRTGAARIRLIKTPGTTGTGYLLIDDVIFVERD